jgi:ribonuclease J
MARLRERRMENEVSWRDLQPRIPVEIGPFVVEPIQVTHSIPQAVALAIRTPAGIVLHSGDYKIDQTPPDDRAFDWMRFSQYGEEGVLLLLADSTNADGDGWTGSERSVREELHELIRNATGRVFVSTFSSHAHRLRQVIEIARQHDRKIGVVGRSLTSNLRVFKEHGEIEIDPKQELPVKELAKLPERNQLYLTTGCQGEALAALSRIALGEDKNLTANRGDRVIISARIIPGNERRISTLVSHFYKLGVEVYTETRNPGIHVSGHAHREEMRVLLNLVRPRYLIPIHGEYRLLVEHCDLGRQVGIPTSSCIVVEDGQVVEVVDGKIRLGGSVSTGRVLIDEGSLDQVEEIVIRDRQHLSEDGIVIPITAINVQSGDMEAEIITRGLVWVDEEEELMQRARELLLGVVEEMSEEERGDLAVVKAQMRRALRRFFRKEMGKGPMIIPVVLEV